MLRNQISFPPELWDLVIKQVWDFDTIVTLSQTSPQLKALVLTNDSHVAKILKNNDPCIHPFPASYGTCGSPFSPSSQGRWLTTGLLYQKINQNISNRGVSGEIIEIDEYGCYYNSSSSVMEDLRIIPEDFGQIAITARYPADRQYYARSLLASEKSRAVFCIDSVIKNQNYPVIEFGSKLVWLVKDNKRNLQHRLPDCQYLSDSYLYESDLSPNENEREFRLYDFEQFLSGISFLNHGIIRHHVNLSYLNADEDVIIHTYVDDDLPGYVATAVRPQGILDTILWSISIPIDNDIFGVANILFTNEYILVIQNRLRIFEIESRHEVLRCPIHQFPFLRFSAGYFATTHTHLFAIHGLELYAIGINDILRERNAYLDNWNLVFNFRDISGTLLQLQERFMFSSNRYYGHLISLSLKRGMCVLDLVKGSAVFFCPYTLEPPSPALVPRIYSLREESRSNIDNWVIDTSGRVVFVPNSMLKEIYGYIGAKTEVSLKIDQLLSYKGQTNTFKL